MTAFTLALQEHMGLVFTDYEQLHAFSVAEYGSFWRVFIDWARGLDWSGSAEPVCVGDTCEDARFFPCVELSYAGTLLNLSVAPSDAPALTACHADGRRVQWTRGALRERVACLAQALETLGLRAGDRVAAVMRNDDNAIVTALAVTALGATLSTAAPEMGVESLLDRFTPLEPRLLFAHTAVCAFDTGLSLAGKIAALSAALPTLESVVTLDGGPFPSSVMQRTYSLGELINNGDASCFVWRRFAFNHPLFIMFSSGTTGMPKCIVHGAGGTLLEHLKEHRLHSDLRPGEKLYFHTSCAWMMWNWQLSALASGVEIVTYDGPIVTPDTLWRLVADERVSVFGTSAAYLKMCEEAGLEPGRQLDLGALRAMMSTGAVLYDAQYRWVRDHVKPLPLQSISGGTDILGCFVLGNPNLPVYAGEAQCKSLALDVQAWEGGARCAGVGQLVCVNPFPSRPLGFFGDTDGTRFHAAYFAANPGVWTHGDLIEFSAQGTARLHGRSDGVLNVRGINVGPGEIYRVLIDIPGIREAMVVEQRLRRVPVGDEGTAAYEQRVVLLLVLYGGVTLNAALNARVRRELAYRASPAHVPDVIVVVDALPVTHNGKPSESAARNAVNGLPVGNVSALRNPESLAAIRAQVALNAGSRTLPLVGESFENLERHLIALWENLFCFGPIDREDNFFDLGGDSLLATELATQVQRATGRTIPLAALVIAPTIERLAPLIKEGTLPAASSTLVPMRAGEGTPLFWLHSVTGSIMECLPLVRAMRSPRPILGVQARGLNGDEPVQQRVADMAAAYVEQIRSVQPHGPYALAGYSFGGLLALEVAQRLHRAGEPIDLLCLLDTYAHERWLPGRAWLQHQCHFIAQQWRALRDQPAAQRKRFVAGKLASAADRVRLRLGRMARQPAAHAVGLPPVLLRMRETMRVAMATYRPRAYEAGPIIYVRAAVPQENWADPLSLWRHIARCGLTVIDMPGKHTDIIAEPNVSIVAQALDHVLEGLPRFDAVAAAGA